MHTFIQPKLLARAVGLAVAAITLPSVAQQVGGIQEVIVTAQKTAENLQTTPIAITALTSEALEQKGITTLMGVVAETPSLSFTPYPSAANLMIVYMRGQGVADPMQVTSDGSVGIYSDGFYLARPQAVSFDLADMERVEVLRGPQGTLYGRNTTGGAVNLISKKPSGEFGFKQQLTFGNLGLFRSLTTVDLPAVGDVAAKITLLKSQRDGLVKNSGSSHDYGEQGSTAGRLALRWQASDSFAADYFFETGTVESTPMYYQNPFFNGMNINGQGTYYARPDGANSRTYRPVDLDGSSSRFEGHGLTLSWDINDNMTLKSLTGYRTLNFEANQDYAEVFNATFITWDEVKEHQFSQELQLIGGIPDAGIRYVSGLYYFTESTGHHETIDYGLSFIPNGLAVDRDVKAKARSYAAYAQVTWTPDILDNKLDLVFGARFTKDKREASRYFNRFSFVTFQNEVLEDGGTTYNIESSRFNPSFTANYAFNDDINGYAKVATGYKSGGFVESSPIGQFNNAINPEKVITYELGMKSFWWERRVRTNIAVFMSKFDDMQMNFQTNPNDQAETSGYNAGKATVKGFELEILVQPIDDLSLTLDYSWLDPTLDRVEALPGTVFDPNTNSAVLGSIALGQDIKSLFNMPYAPRHSVNAGIDYTFLHLASSTLSASLNYRFQSRLYDTAPTGRDVPGRELYSVDPYGLFDARLTWAVDLPRGDKARVALWGKNILDKAYQAQVTGVGGGPVPVTTFSGTIPAGYTSHAQIWAEPATYGIDLIYEY